jgi:uncharacterized protein (TIGR02246 family)
MNRFTIIALSAVMLAYAPGPSLAAPADEVNVLIGRWVEAFNSNDAQALAKLYAQDATLLGTLSPTLAENSESVQKYFSFLPGSSAKVSVGELRIIAISDTSALATGFYDFAETQDGKPLEVPARFTFVAIKRGNDWFIIHHHSSRRPEPPK